LTKIAELLPLQLSEHQVVLINIPPKIGYSPNKS